MAKRSTSSKPRPRPKPESVADLYGDGEAIGLLKGMYDTPDIHAMLQRRHLKGMKLIEKDGYYRSGEHEWKVPYGVRACMKSKLVHNQVAVRRPFYATWISPKTGKRLKKYFSTMIGAIDFVATKAQYVDENASVVSRSVGYDIPKKLRGKLPRKIHGQTRYWCPYCMTERRYKRSDFEAYFYAVKKVWSEEKQRYKWVERKLALLRCTVCDNPNRDPKFRRSNQPWEVRRIKKGVRRAKRRK